MKTYRALAALLQYPTGDLAGATREIAAVVKADAKLSRTSLDAIERLTTQIGTGDLLTAQENYVALFDRSRSLSLHLFEHIHGESRDRGQAMVNLATHYNTYGYSIDGNELPDYLPLFLEFLSLIDPGEAADLLAEVIHILAAIRIRLERRDSGYAGLFQAMEELAARRPDSAAVAELLGQDRSPAAEAAELDKEWEEAPAFAGDGSCPAARDTLNRIAELTAGARSDTQGGG